MTYTHAERTRYRLTMRENLETFARYLPKADFAPAGSIGMEMEMNLIDAERADHLAMGGAGAHQHADAGAVDEEIEAKRDEQAMQARLRVRTAELASWDAKVLQNFDGAADALRKAKATNDRALEKAGMTVEQHIKRLKRFASRASAALNSTGVSVDSQATESNQVDAEQA